MQRDESTYESPDFRDKEEKQPPIDNEALQSQVEQILQRMLAQQQLQE